MNNNRMKSIYNLRISGCLAYEGKKFVKRHTRQQFF